MFNILSEKSHSFAKSFDEWTRILHISTISHVIAPATVPNVPTRQENSSSIQRATHITNTTGAAHVHKDNIDSKKYYRH